MGAIGPLEVLVLLAVSLVPAVLFWRIFSKAGFPGAVALLALIPGLGFTALVLVLALLEWPIERELREARQGGHA